MLKIEYFVEIHKLVPTPPTNFRPYWSPSGWSFYLFEESMPRSYIYVKLKVKNSCTGP